MDNTIIEMFKEKNDKILIEKLLLDLDNNDDSLRLTINNKIELLVSVKFLKKINSILKNSGIEYDVKTLNEIGEELKKTIKEKIELLLDFRKKNISVEITNTFSEISNLFNIIDNQEELIKQKLESLINEIIYSELENQLFNLYTFKSEEQKEDIGIALEKFDSLFTCNILESLRERNYSLKNMMNETYDKVVELNEKTTEINEKVMKKETA